jgi:phospholipid/cholesterol/gamma-HCH transport system permease protein
MIAYANTVARLCWICYAGFSQVYWLRRTRDRQRLLEEFLHAGYRSLPLVMLIGLFAGAIIAWQAAYQFRGLVSLNLLGGQSARIIVMEMAPVMTGMVIAGRMAAPMASSIAARKATGQLDALTTLGINPFRFIVMPHLLAMTIMMPVLAVFSNTTGIFGCWFVSEYFLDIGTVTFWSSVRDFFNPLDLAGGLLKAFTFGLFMSIITAYCGFYSGFGQMGIRNAGTQAFVYSAIMILVSDFWLWFLLF